MPSDRESSTMRRGYDPAWVEDRIRGISATLFEVFHLADNAGISTAVAAERLAVERLYTCQCAA